MSYAMRHDVFSTSSSFVSLHQWYAEKSFRRGGHLDEGDYSCF